MTICHLTGVFSAVRDVEWKHPPFQHIDPSLCFFKSSHFTRIEIEEISKAPSNRRFAADALKCFIGFFALDHSSFASCQCKDMPICQLHCVFVEPTFDDQPKMMTYKMTVSQVPFNLSPP